MDTPDRGRSYLSQMQVSILGQEKGGGEMKVTLSKGGTKERQLDINHIRIPDLWHIAMAVGDNPCFTKLHQDEILECWHLAHDLKRHIAEQEGT